MDELELREIEQRLAHFRNYGFIGEAGLRDAQQQTLLNDAHALWAGMLRYKSLFKHEEGLNADLRADLARMTEERDAWRSYVFEQRSRMNYLDNKLDIMYGKLLMKYGSRP